MITESQRLVAVHESRIGEFFVCDVVCNGTRLRVSSFAFNADDQYAEKLMNQYSLGYMFDADDPSIDVFDCRSHYAKICG